jgi:hypothetical protein
LKEPVLDSAGAIVSALGAEAVASSFGCAALATVGFLLVDAAR